MNETVRNHARTFRRFKSGELMWDDQDLTKKIFQGDHSHKCPTYVGRTAPCQASCPSGHDIRGWLAIARGMDKPPVAGTQPLSSPTSSSWVRCVLLLPLVHLASGPSAPFTLPATAVRGTWWWRSRSWSWMTPCAPRCPWPLPHPVCISDVAADVDCEVGILQRCKNPYITAYHSSYSFGKQLWVRPPHTPPPPR